MVKALSVITTGDLFRIAASSIFVHQGMKDGGRVECYNALLKLTYKGKKTYDKLVTFVFDSRFHRIVEANNDRVLGNEKRRARELVCQRFHRGKCGLPPYEDTKETPPVSIVRDEKYWEDETVRVIGLCLEYLRTPHKFDRTRQSVLTMDAEILDGRLRKRAKQRAEGSTDGSKESGVGGGTEVPRPT
jgi:hypothetical protein